MTASAIPAGMGHAQCHACNLVMTIPEEASDSRLGCSRCHTVVHRRKPNSLTRTSAMLIAAMICYVPANVYPIMAVTSFGKVQADTIFSGAVYLFVHGMWPLALIVFVASIVVPTLKLIGLTLLVVSVRRHSQWRPAERARLYRIIEIVGRWSMVDVYVVTILVALVHLGSIASVEAETGAFFFGTVVVLTLLAAQSFDPRLIWDSIEDNDE
jgi:paraquat-inducible protein A